MSSSIDSLSGLTRVAKEVESTLSYIATPEGIACMNRGIFERLRVQINDLQLVAPNHRGVLKARVQWYELAINSFETHVVHPAEKGDWPYESYSLNYAPDNAPAGFLTGTETIGHFLKRLYLKDSFGHFYIRVLVLYQRIANAPVTNPARNVFNVLATNLEGTLLNGRM